MDFKKIYRSVEIMGKRNATFWGNKLAEETGELCQILNRFELDNLHDGDFSMMDEEIADVIICAMLIGQFLNSEPKNIEFHILQKIKEKQS